MDAWDVGSHVSCDEQTIGFQGWHQDKLRINYKKEGDGFQADTICESGYTYGFTSKMYLHLRNTSRRSAPRFIQGSCSFSISSHAKMLCTGWTTFTSAWFCKEALLGKN
jgi:hypothetical protein